MSLINQPQLEILISKDELRARTIEMGAQITKDYEGLDLIVIGVLNGCFVFLADLVREIDLELTTDFLGLSSYGDSTSSSGVVAFT